MNKSTSDDNSDKREPIHISKADVHRAYVKVKEFKKLVERGKTPQQIFDDLVRLIEIDESNDRDL